MLISFSRVSDESQSPRRWKQWLHTARLIRDSDTPVQPKRANAKATMSVDEVGGVLVTSDPGGLKYTAGMRFIISCTEGSG